MNLPDMNSTKDIEPEGSFCWLYENNQKSICCFGARHSFGYNEQVEKIIQTFNEYKPECVVVEAYKEKIEQKDFSGIITNLDEKFTGNEVQLGLNLAVKNNLPVYNCEPTKQEEIYEMLKLYKVDEILAFYVLRGVAQYQRMIEKPGTMQEYLGIDYQRYLGEMQILKPKLIISKEDIFDVYKKWFGKDVFELSPNEIDKYVWPTKHELEWKKSNTIAKSSVKIRDEAVVKGILLLLKKYNRIFIIYGKSHIPVWDEVFKKNLGILDHKDLTK